MTDKEFLIEKISLEKVKQMTHTHHILMAILSLIP